MASWQTRVLYKILKAIVKFNIMPRKIQINKLRNLFNLLSKFVIVSEEITFQKIVFDQIEAEWIYTPETESPDKVIFYLHGGAYFLGSVKTYHYLLGKLAQITKAKIFAVNYRLAPEHPFPAALNDAITAYKWLTKQISPNKIIIAGDSAGSGLAIATLILLRDQHLPLPKASILLSPWLDLALTGKSINYNADKDYFISPNLAAKAAQLYLNFASTTHPLASPLYAELKGLPPCYIQTGSAEILYSDAIRFAQKAQQSGVNIELDVWPNMIHGWHFFGSFFPESREALLSIGKYLRTLKD